MHPSVESPPKTNDSLGVADGAGFDLLEGGLEGEDDGLQELVVIEVGAAEDEVLGEEQRHFFIEDAGSSIEAAQAFPALGAVAGFFFQLAAGAADRLFAGMQRAG